MKKVAIITLKIFDILNVWCSGVFKGSKLPNLEKNTPSSSPWHWIYLCTSLIITVLVYREIWELQAILQGFYRGYTIELPYLCYSV